MLGMWEEPVTKASYEVVKCNHQETKPRSSSDIDNRDGEEESSFDKHKKVKSKWR